MKTETAEHTGVPLSAALTQSSCTTAQAARILGVSVGTVQKLVERNELQAWRTPGGHRRVLLNSLHHYQQSHQIPVQGGPASKVSAGLRMVLVDDFEPHARVFDELEHVMSGLVRCDQGALVCRHSWAFPSLSPTS